MSLENYQKIETDVCITYFYAFPVWFSRDLAGIRKGWSATTTNAMPPPHHHLRARADMSATPAPGGPGAQIFAHACILLEDPKANGACACAVNKKDGTSQIAGRQFLLVRFLHAIELERLWTLSIALLWMISSRPAYNYKTTTSFFLRQQFSQKYVYEFIDVSCTHTHDLVLFFLTLDMRSYGLCGYFTKRCCGRCPNSE